MDFIWAVAKMAKADPHMLDLARQQPLFPEVEDTVVALIANADSVDEALLAFEDLRGLIPDWKFVFASDRGPVPGLSVNRTFSDGSVVRSLFSTERALVLDEVTRGEMLAHDAATFPIDYSISLDTQALSYLAPFMEGKSAGIPDDFHEIFAFIAQDNVFVDATPYITENLSNVLAEPEKIRLRLQGYESLRTIDAAHFQQTGELRSTATQSEREENVDRILSRMTTDASEPATMAAALHAHSRLYCLLLKMATIQLRRPQPELAAGKIAEFMDFMDGTLQTICAREAIVAAEYFARKQGEFRFFNKIQTKHPKNRINLKNMAWDLFHIRHIELAATFAETMSDDPLTSPRYFFPALLTCDIGFIEVIDLYPLKSYAYKKGSNRPMPFTALDWIAKITACGATEADGTSDPDAEALDREAREAEFIQKYLSRSAVKRREENRDPVLANFDQILAEVEEEFCKVAKCP